MARPRGSKQERQAQARLRNGAKGKLFGYVRVSTKEQGESGHSLHGQRERLRQAAEAAGYELLDIVQDVQSGTKQRENLVQVQKRIDDGQAEGVIFGKLDRLGRSQIHLAQLVKWAKDTGVTLLSADEGMQVERGELRNEALPFLIAFAEVESERIRRRTKEGLAAARARGVVLGAQPENTGRLSQRATRLRREGWGLQQIADKFNSEGKRTARGAEFKAMTIYRMVNRIDPSANPVGGH